MEIVPISRRNISRQVYDQMLDNILNGVWPPGTKLPSENELTQMFGVSRVPIREALKKLSTMGITQTRQGGSQAGQRRRDQSAVPTGWPCQTRTRVQAQRTVSLRLVTGPPGSRCSRARP